MTGCQLGNFRLIIPAFWPKNMLSPRADLPNVFFAALAQKIEIYVSEISNQFSEYSRAGRNAASRPRVSGSPCQLVQLDHKRIAFYSDCSGRKPDLAGLNA